MSLERFVAAQEGVIDGALAELNAGAKRGHWMWFVFPQLRGLGRSPTARRYAIADAAEARAYRDHPVLGPRLLACAEAMLAHAGTPPERVLGATDAQKLRSSATLFAALPGADPAFGRILAEFYGGAPCPATRAALSGSGSSG